MSSTFPAVAWLRQHPAFPAGDPCSRLSVTRQIFLHPHSVVHLFDLICAVGPDSSFVLLVQTAQLCCWFRQLICAVGPGAHPQTLAVIDHLKGLLKSVGKLEEAEPLYREALAACRAASAPGDPSVVKAVVNLGMLLKSRGNLEEAEVLYREALETRRSTLGNLHPDTIVSINNLAMLLKNSGADCTLHLCC